MGKRNARTSYCEDCGIIIDFDTVCGDDVVRPARIVDGSVVCDRCARDPEEHYEGDVYPWDEYDADREPL